LERRASKIARTRPDFVGSQMNIRDDTVHTAQLAFGYETFGYSHKHFLTLKILQALLGQWSITDFSGIYFNVNFKYKVS
jgi:hypothetical protein